MANALGDKRYKALATTPGKHWDGVETFDFEALGYSPERAAGLRTMGNKESG